MEKTSESGLVQMLPPQDSPVIEEHSCTSGGWEPESLLKTEKVKPHPWGGEVGSSGEMESPVALA